MKEGDNPELGYVARRFKLWLLCHKDQYVSFHNVVIVVAFVVVLLYSIDHY
jgi:hypothetical protein